MVFIKAHKKQFLLAGPLAAVAVAALAVTGCGGGGAPGPAQGAAPGQWTRAEVSQFTAAAGAGSSDSQDSCAIGYFERDMSFGNAMAVVSVDPYRALGAWTGRPGQDRPGHQVRHHRRRRRRHPVPADRHRLRQQLHRRRRTVHRTGSRPQAASAAATSPGLGARSQHISSGGNYARIGRHYPGRSRVTGGDMERRLHLRPHQHPRPVLLRRGWRLLLHDHEDRA